MCIVVLAVLLVWVSSGSSPEACDHLYNDMSAVYVCVEFFKAKHY